MTFGRLTAKAVARRVMGIFGHPTALQNKISDLIDESKTLDEALRRSPELQEIRMKYSTEFNVMKRLEGVISHVGQHAGGTLIYQGLSDLLPLTWDDENEMFVAPYDMETLHELGFYKMDVLGLETLPIIHGAVEEMKKDGIEIDLENINLEDESVYDMLCKGDVSGVFQLNNQGAKIVEQQPRNFRDLIAINALIRPGVGDWEEYIARRRGHAWETHPDRLPYLKETEGIITYQEQFMLDCKTFAGWDLAFADKKVRKNKDIRNDKELKEKFINDGKKNGYEEEDLIQIWKEIEDAVDGGLKEGSPKTLLIQGTPKP